MINDKSTKRIESLLDECNIVMHLISENNHKTSLKKCTLQVQLQCSWDSCHWALTQILETF